MLGIVKRGGQYIYPIAFLVLSAPSSAVVRSRSRSWQAVQPNAKSC